MHLWEDTFLWLAEQAARRLAKTKTYNVAITACGKGANWRAALTCFQEIFLAKLQPDVVTYNSAITACTQGTSWPTSLLLFFDLLDTRLEPDSFTLSAALCACEPVGKWELAASVLHDFGPMTTGSIGRNTMVWNAGISVHSRAGEWERAIDLLTRMYTAGVQRSEVSCNAAIFACSRVGQWLRAVSLLRHMQEQLLRADTISYNAAMAWEGSGNWEVALGLLAELLESSMGPSIVTYGSLMKACASEEQWQTALLCFEEVQRSSLQMSVIAYTAAISSCEKGSHWELALCCLFDCARREMVPDIMSFNTAITACGNADQLRRVRLLHAILRRRQIRENLSTFNALIVSHGRASQWQQAVAYLADLVALNFRPDAITFNALSSACTKNDKWECALQLLAEAQQAQLPADNVSYGTRITALARAGRWEQVLLLLADLEAEGCVPDVIVYNAAIAACEDAWQVCLRLLGDLQRKQLTADARTITSLISACRRSSAWQPALQLLSMQRAYCVSDMSYCYNAAISTCGRADQWQVVVDLLSSMVEDALRPDLMGYDPALAAIVSSGQQEQALELLWSSESSWPPVSFLWCLATVGVSDAEVIHEACVEVALGQCHGEELSRVLWSLDILGAENSQFCRSTIRRFLKQFPNVGLDELAMAVSGLISLSSEPFAADLIQRHMAGELRRLRQIAPSRLAFNRLGISAMGILGSLATAGRLRQSLQTAVHDALLEVGRDLDRSTRETYTLPSPPLPQEQLPASVVWNQADRAVLFKPPGWEVYGAHTALQLSSFAALHFGRLRILDDDSHNSGFLHRLDVPSSGLIMMAKSYAAFYDLQLQLHLGTFGREYTSLVHGWLAKSLSTVTAKVQSGTKGPTTSGGRGKWSQTRLRRMGYLWHPVGTLTRLLLQIVTGRKHQIRSHMAYIGHPTVRDGLYTSNVTFQEDAALCDRNWLHRHLLSFRDRAGKFHEIHSPLPQDLRNSFITACACENVRCFMLLLAVTLPFGIRELYLLMQS
ncbi:EMB2654 [Symbiodinium sp. CCMP2456]|nr:EMB2654 [Symbiodinium sp. CCMP2456]